MQHMPHRRHSPNLQHRRSTVCVCDSVSVFFVFAFWLCAHECYFCVCIFIREVWFFSIIFVKSVREVYFFHFCFCLELSGVLNCDELRLRVDGITGAGWEIAWGFLAGGWERFACSPDRFME